MATDSCLSLKLIKDETGSWPLM